MYRDYVLSVVTISHVCVYFALTPAVLTFEPQNAIILDYQATLAQYINNGEEPQKWCP